MANWKPILTPYGLAAFAASAVGGPDVVITDVALGDGGGVVPEFDGTELGLVNELRRIPIISATINPPGSNKIEVVSSVPPADGGYIIREAAVYDVNGAMLAISGWGPQIKPVPAEMGGIDLILKMRLEIVNAGSVTFVSAGSVIFATRTVVNRTFQEVVNWNTLNW